jgi:hypothetical protein
MTPRRPSCSCTAECLLVIEAYDFDWLRASQLKDPVRSEPGDRVRVSCVFDNTTDHDVNWGDGTSDEMCLAVAYLTPQGWGCALGAAA